MKLYHYVHCPFCIRVRMGLGFLHIPYDSHVLSYDDEQSPLTLTGVKMLPIVVNDKGEALNESLDILKSLDESNKLSWQSLTSENNQIEIEELLTQIGNPVHSLCMPYWVWTPEFNEASRTYFQKKKEVKRGPFKHLIQYKDAFIETLNQILSESIEKNLTPFYKSQTLTIIDIMLASHLWGMYIFPEYQFSPKIHHYLQSIKAATFFDYHSDFWK